MKITVKTKELVVRTYDIEVELPLAAKDAVYRHVVRDAVVSDELLRACEKQGETDADFQGEKIILVESDLGQLYPRVRKPRSKVIKGQTTVEDQLNGKDEHGELS